MAATEGQFAGKIAVVTGAGNGIGRAAALAFAQEGADVALLDWEADALAGSAELVAAQGVRALPVVGDMTVEAEVEAAFARVAAELGPVDVLVNNLGGNVDQGFFVDSDPDKWAGDIDLNFGTVLRMTHAVLKGMVARKRGSIVNVGSTAGLVGDYMLPVYSAMKGAVHSFTVVLAKEVGQHNIRVNAIAPYATFSTTPEAYSSGSRFHPETGLFAQGGDSINEEDRAIRQRRTFVGRPFATPEELSGVVALLASDRASFVTGQVWPIDGGSLM